MSRICSCEIDGIESGNGLGCFGIGQIRYTSTLTEDSALAMVRMAVEVARSDGGGPIAVGVVDAAGELIAFLRNDGAPLRAIKIAIMKAYTSARFARTTLALERMLEESGRPLVEYGDGMLTALPGGIPLDAEGEIVGGMGVSGRSPREDHELALRAVDGLRLTLDDKVNGHAHKCDDRLNGSDLR